MDHGISSARRVDVVWRSSTSSANDPGAADAAGTAARVEGRGRVPRPPDRESEADGALSSWRGQSRVRGSDDRSAPRLNAPHRPFGSGRVEGIRRYSHDRRRLFQARGDPARHGEAGDAVVTITIVAWLATPPGESAVSIARLETARCARDRGSTVSAAAISPTGSALPPNPFRPFLSSTAPCCADTVLVLRLPRSPLLYRRRSGRDFRHTAERDPRAVVASLIEATARAARPGDLPSAFLKRQARLGAGRNRSPRLDSRAIGPQGCRRPRGTGDRFAP